MKTRMEPSLGKCLAILGTASDVGKSVVVTALCRIFHDRGIRVAPFKAQNMSNNSFVTLDGGEMGRAQVVQAEAAQIEPHSDMNPVLLKPNSDLGSQVILNGKSIGSRTASNYGELTNMLREHATESLNRLRSEYEMVVMEGAGSCAEINLMKRDFVNLPMARIAQAPVILVADIDRGGVFAQIVGTLEVLQPVDRQLIKGCIINRFRGEPELFEDGIDFLEERTGIPILGVIPYLHDMGIDQEDAVVLEPSNQRTAIGPKHNKVNIAIIKLPHISNFTDFAPLQNEKSVKVDYLEEQSSLVDYDLVVIPGTKNVRGDLAWLKERGWETRIREYVEKEGNLCGICGGYQMLGKTVEDPLGIEGAPGTTHGLCMLDVATTLHREKVLTRTEALCIANNKNITGYEIHQGRTEREDHVHPVFKIVRQSCRIENYNEGACSENGRVFGTYIHGLFDEAGFRRSLLAHLRPDLEILFESEGLDDASQTSDRKYAQLADHVFTSVDTEAILKISGLL